VISKKDMDENLYKIAIHISNQGEETFYDAADSTLSNREKVFFKNAFPEMWKTIKKYHDDAHPDETVDKIKQSLSTNDVFTERLVLSDITILNTINGFELVEHNGNNFIVHSNLKIYEKKESNQSLLDEYLIFISANLKKINSSYGLEINYQFGDSGSEIKIDLGFDGFAGNFNFIVNQTTIIDSTIATYILDFVRRILQKNSILLKHIHKTPVWTPDRIHYGYTFGKNKGLIKKLVDWLDEGKVGTKLDFLANIGKLEKRTKDNNKSEYKFPGGDSWKNSSDFRGHFSSFFASAKNSGILSYRKIGNQFLLVKGPNFEAFKRGELKAL